MRTKLKMEESSWLLGSSTIIKPETTVSPPKALCFEHFSKTFCFSGNFVLPSATWTTWKHLHISPQRSNPASSASFASVFAYLSHYLSNAVPLLRTCSCSTMLFKLLWWSWKPQVTASCILKPINLLFSSAWGTQATPPVIYSTASPFFYHHRNISYTSANIRTTSSLCSYHNDHNQFEDHKRLLKPVWGLQAFSKTILRTTSSVWNHSENHKVILKTNLRTTSPSEPNLRTTSSFRNRSEDHKLL